MRIKFENISRLQDETTGTAFCYISHVYPGLAVTGLQSILLSTSMPLTVTDSSTVTAPQFHSPENLSTALYLGSSYPIKDLPVTPSFYLLRPLQALIVNLPESALAVLHVTISTDS